MKEQETDRVADHDAEICMIVAMGFSAERASLALEASGGDIDVAIESLLSNVEEESFQQDKPGKAGAATMARPDEAYLIPDSGPQVSPPNDVAYSAANLRQSNNRGFRIHQHDVMDDTIDKPLTRNKNPTCTSTNMPLQFSGGQSIYPGAVAVRFDDDIEEGEGTVCIGSGEETGSDEEDHTKPANMGTTYNSTLPISAEVVEDREQDYDRLELELQRRDEQLRRVLAERENVPLAQVITQHDEEAPPPERSNDDKNETDSSDSSYAPRNKICGTRTRRTVLVFLNLILLLAVAGGVAMYIFWEEITE